MTRGRKPQVKGPTAWQSSAEFREIARAAARKQNHLAKSEPLCGAAKRDGKPCRNLAMKNGRCRIHGGTTPADDNWHVVRWPDPNSLGANEKLHRKLKDRERRAAQRAARIAAMTPEQRAKHEHWHRTHKPGSAAARRREKALRLQNQAVLGILTGAGEDPPLSPESIALRERVRQLEETAAAMRADLAEMEARAQSPGDPLLLPDCVPNAFENSETDSVRPPDPIGVFA